VTPVRLLAARVTNRGSRVLIRAVNLGIIPVARGVGTRGHPHAARRLIALAGHFIALSERLAEWTTRIYELDWEASNLPYSQHPRNPRWRHLAERRREAETKRNA
jgi:hypothetical protein